MPPAEGVSALEDFGFSAIYLSRRGSTNTVDVFAGKLAIPGRTNIFEDSLHEQACLVLSPRAIQTVPPVDDYGLVNYGRGWLFKPPQDGWYWARREAEVKFFSEEKNARLFELSFVIASADPPKSLNPRHVELVMKGTPIWSATLNGQQSVSGSVSVVGQPGYNKLWFRTTEPPELGSVENRPSVSYFVSGFRAVRKSAILK
jgi:hypothetical protein